MTVRIYRNLISNIRTDYGTAISSIVVAIQMITAYCKHLKYKRKIVLVTNGEGPMSADSLNHITKKLKADSIELVILFVCLCCGKFKILTRRQWS